MQFFVRTKKPKVYSLAALAGLAVLALILLAGTLREDWVKWANLTLSLLFAAMIFVLLDAFAKQLQYNPYSYNTIIYPGFSLFLLSLLLTHAYAAVQGFLHPGVYTAEQLLFTLVHSAKNYMFVTSPFLLAFSGALLVSNIALIRHEGRRFVNLLGIVLAVALVGGEILIGILDLYSAFSSDGDALWRNLLVNLLAAFYLYFECMIVGAILADFIAARHKAPLGQDFLIVLGCGLKKDGTPTPLLKGRVDLALDFYRRQLAEGGKPACFVVSGGQGPDEVQSEAASMRGYLLEQGIGEDRIRVEDRSRDTAENMRFSRAIIDRENPKARIAFFTTNYHVFRSGLKARQAGMKAVGMGAPTKWYFWPNAAVREFVGLLTEHRLKQGLLLAGLALGYAALTVLAYG